MNSAIHNAKAARYEAFRAFKCARADAFLSELRTIAALVSALRDHPEGLTSRQLECIIHTASNREIIGNLKALKHGTSRFQRYHNFSLFIPNYEPKRGDVYSFEGIEVPDLNPRRFSCKRSVEYRGRVYFDSDGRVLPVAEKESYETFRWFYK